MSSIPPPAAAGATLGHAAAHDAAAATPAPPDASRPYPHAPHGLGGWLLVFVLVLLGQIGFAVAAIVQTAPGLQPLALKAIKNDASAKLLAPIIHLGQFEIVSSTVLILFALGLLAALFWRWRWMRRLVLVWVLVYATLSVIDLVMAGEAMDVMEHSGYSIAGINNQLGSIVRNVFAMVVWGLYFLRSKRVRNTFRKL